MKRQAKPDLLQILLCVALLATYLVFIFILPPLQPASVTVQTSTPDTYYQAQVIKVTDGDSITVRAGTLSGTGDENVKIRLAEIDAPERGQPWGDRSRQELASLVAGKTVIVQPKGKDRYGRTIAHVVIDGRDVNAVMIDRGAAWAYRAYLEDQSLIVAEAQAKSGGVGLWALPEGQRLPPWEYRAAQNDDAPVFVGR